mgnify:CR=1 FL=1
MALVLLNAFVLKELHYLLDHHHHHHCHHEEPHEQPNGESDGEWYLHGELSQAEQCFLCLTLFTPFETPDEEVLLSVPAIAWVATAFFTYTNPHSGNDRQHLFLRGPPVA